MADLADFGYGRLHFGRDGDVPLVVVLCEFEGMTAFSAPPGFDTYADAMLDRLLGAKPSTGAWFRSTFGRGFQLVGERAWGPIFVPRSFYMVKGPDGVEQWRSEAERLTFVKQQACALLSAAGLFAVLDRDQNLLIDGDELCLVVFDNGSVGGAMNRGSSEVNLGQPPVVAPSLVAVYGIDCDGLTMTHELLHSFGADDLYGAGFSSMPLTIMSGTGASGPQIRNQRRMDPWHELTFGLTAPIVRDITTPGSTNLGPAHFADRAIRCLLLFDPLRGPNEFFLVQFRTPAEDDTDDETYSHGWCVWQVRLNAGKGSYAIQAASSDTNERDSSVNHLGSPKLTLGGDSLWPPGATPELRWLDGMPTGVRLNLGMVTASSTSGSVNWEVLPDSSRFLEPIRQALARPVATLSTPGLAFEYGYELASWTDEQGTLHWAQWLDDITQLPWGIPNNMTGSARGSAMARGEAHGLALAVSSGSGIIVFCEAFGPEGRAIPGALSNFSPAVCWHRDRLFVSWQDSGKLMLAAYNSISGQWTLDRVPDADPATPDEAERAVWEAGVARGRISDRSSPALCSTGDQLYVCWIGVDDVIRFRRCSKGMNWLDREGDDYKEHIRTLPPGSVHPLVVPHPDACVVRGVALTALDVDNSTVPLVAFTDDEDRINFSTLPYPPYEGARRLKSASRTYLAPSMVVEGERIGIAFQQADPSRSLMFAGVSGLDLHFVTFVVAAPP